MLVDQIMLGVCNACQIGCEWCAHRSVRAFHPSYQMPLVDVSVLLDRMAETGTTTNYFMFNGPGEPLLWRHFNAGVRLLKASGLGQKIKLQTNALMLSTIAEDVWPMLDRVYISKYGQPLDAELISRKHEQIEYYDGSVFTAPAPNSFPLAVKGSCECYGPFYYNRHVFPRCGPPVFGAALLAGTDPILYAVPVSQWHPAEEPIPVDMLPCAWCEVNGAVKRIHVKNDIHPERFV